MQQLFDLSLVGSHVVVNIWRRLPRASGALPSDTKRQEGCFALIDQGSQAANKDGIRPSIRCANAAMSSSAAGVRCPARRDLVAVGRKAARRKHGSNSHE